MQAKITEPINFLAMRQERGLTLAQAAKLSGYSVPTINGLELRNEGSERLRKRLMEIYMENAKFDAESIKVQASLPPIMQEDAAEPSAEEWKRRALDAEAKLRHLQQACDALGQHVEGLASTVRHFSSIITE